MKYTVLIRQPVSDEVRPLLEEQLVQRFGLKPEQAQRLAARRAGRLMKPTSHARAELLLQVFESVGAQVSLEEVRPETGTAAPSTAAPLPADEPGTSTTDPFATPAAPDPFAIPAADPFAPLAPDPFAALASNTPEKAQPVLTTSDDDGLLIAPPSTVMTVSAATSAVTADPDQADELPDWAKAASAKLEKEQEKGQPAEGANQAPAGADDWADFTGALNVSDDAPASERPVRDVSRQSSEFLTAVGDDVAVSGQPRNSVTQQIRLGTLLPLALSGLLTMLLMALTLPRLQNRLTQENAQTLASVVGTSLNTRSAGLESQLAAIAKNPNVGFVRVEVPNGPTTLRSLVTSDLGALNTRLGDWAKSGEASGQFRIGNQSYTISRVSIIRNSQGALSAVPVGAENKAPVVRRVMVGLSNGQALSNLRNTLLLVLLMTLLGLVLALTFAARAARQIVGPLERLVEVADAISLGDLTRPVKMERNDEIGDLAQALERMRLSLEAAMDRLRRRKRM